ncbi:MAG: class I SAM-dependent methyltransferase [Promethearchaeota archaeon]
MKSNTTFKKYEIKGSDYHFKQIDKKNRFTFNSFVYARYQIELKLISHILKNRKSKFTKILDIGCGDGVILFLLYHKFKSYNLEIHGIDSSNIALEVAKKRLSNGFFRNTDLYNLPYEDDYFDLILSSDVIEHVSNPEKMLQEIKRVGKNASNVIIGTPIRFSELPLDENHYHEFYPNEFKDFLKNFLKNVRLLQSHKLTYYLLYEKVSLIFKKEIQIYRYLINLLSIYLNINPFMKIKRNDKDLYSYMFAIGLIKK